MAAGTDFFTTPMTLRLGALGTYTIVPQAKVVFLSYALMLGALLFLNIVGLVKSEGVLRRMLLITTVFYILFYPLLIAYMTYVMNCLVVGKCTVLAWILAALAAIFAVIVAVSIIFTAGTGLIRK